MLLSGMNCQMRSGMRLTVKEESGWSHMEVDQSEVDSLFARADEDAKKRGELVTDEDFEEAFATREQLMQSLESRTVNILFEDENGKFVFKARLASPAEIEQITELQQKLLKYMKLEESDVAEDQIEKTVTKGRRLLAEMRSWAGVFCVDPQFNREFWLKEKGLQVMFQ